MDSGDACTCRYRGRVENEVTYLAEEHTGCDIRQLGVAFVSVGVNDAKACRDVEVGCCFDHGHGGRVANQLRVEVIED